MYEVEKKQNIVKYKYLKCFLWIPLIKSDKNFKKIIKMWIKALENMLHIRKIWTESSGRGRH